jgi:hypothetical protein
MTDDTKLDKDTHKSDWMVPPRPNVPKAIEEARQIAKDTYRKARSSKKDPVAIKMKQNSFKEWALVADFVSV